MGPPARGYECGWNVAVIVLPRWPGDRPCPGSNRCAIAPAGPNPLATEGGRPMFDCCRFLLELAMFLGWFLGGSAEAPPGACCPICPNAFEAGCACKDCVCAQG